MFKKIKNVSIFLLIFFLLFSLMPFKASAVLRGTTTNAVLSLSPNSGVYRVGATYSIDILVNTAGQNVSAASAYMTFDPALFTVVSIDTTGSAFSKESEMVIDNINGSLKIGRGAPASPVNQTNAKLATLNIQGKTDTVPPPTSDNFRFVFTAGVKALDSDVIKQGDLGEDILSGVDEGRYTLDGTPPPNIYSFSAAVGNNQISLTWTNPASSDFQGVKILRKTGSYPTSITDGTQVYDSTGTSYTDTGLSNGTTYYYTAFSRDIVLNYSSGAQVSATPQDTTPPASITTLAATALTARTIRLNWTAVGDDGTTGTANSYNIRYSTVTITSANFSSATQATGVPTPGVSGSTQTMTVAGLTGYTTYYFAIKAVDEGSNAGIISNIVSARTFKTSDLDNDSVVGTPDFGILMSNWGLTTMPAADIDQDGIVGTPDFGIMMSQWGIY